ncbi:MAG: MFS transporter, partial [Sphingomonadaceae bacterium]
MQQAASRSEFRLGWKALLAGLLGTMCGASPLPYNTIGFVLEPVNREFGWTFAEISAGITIFGITASLLAPAFGWLADRYGVRIVAILSTLGFAIAFAAIGATPATLIGFYLLWFIVGLIGIGSTPVTWSRAINLWFFRNRGMALGIMLLGTSLAAFIVPQLAVWSIKQFGWRGMYPTVALMPLLIALPVAILWFREPRAAEMPPEAIAGGNIGGVSLAQALRDRRFWTIWFSIICVALAYGGAHIHMPEIIKQHGMSMQKGAAIMAMIGFAILAGRIITGFLLDRFWAPAVCLPILLIPAIACRLLMGTSTDETLIFTAAFML